MNDKVKQLLENAEQTDSLAKLKWRIENREQLRKERKEKLKELMEQDKQKDIVELAFKLYPFSSDSVRNAFITGYNKAKEMECVLLCAKEQRSIELPSDEDIKKMMELDGMEFDEFDPYDVSYLGGAKWMRDKIQEDNDKQ